MVILGIDPSTGKSGVTLITGAGPTVPKYTITLCESKGATPDDRYSNMLFQLMAHIRRVNPELVVVEYPFNIMGNSKVLVEVYGVLRWYCLKIGVPFLRLSQSKIKKYATGSGKAEKSDMRMQVYKEFGLDLTEDEADSFWIAHFGMLYLYPEVKSPKWRHDSVNDTKAPKVKKRKKREY